jgi:hypothetical protein
MAPWVELCLIAAALYAAECCIWSRRDDRVFVQGREKWRAITGPAVEIGASGGLTFGPWWPGRAIVRARRSPSTPAAFDTTAIQTRVDAFAAATRTLTALSIALFSFTFIVLPAWLANLSLAATWIWIVVYVLGMMALIGTAALRADRRLYPRATSRSERILPMMLSPISAMRAPQHLSRDLLDDFHHLAITFVLCDRATFRAAVRRALFDARRADDPNGGEVTRQIEGLLDRTRTRAAVMAAPDAQDNCRAFCPRCDAQYVDASASCADCGVALVSFG